MELHEFVKETLIQIVKGITEAQNDDIIQSNTASIVPHGVSSSDLKLANREIQFDVVVTAQSGSSAKAGLGIFVGGLGVGTQGKLDANDSFENRVKFSVPVLFPMQKVNRNN
jgi:hypothetical protein